MLFGIVLAAFILLSIYLGNVIGCKLLCEMLPTLKRADYMVWKVPFIQLDYIKDMVVAKKWDSLRMYFRTPCKNLIMLSAIVADMMMKDVMKEMEAMKEDGQI